MFVSYGRSGRFSDEWKVSVRREADLNPLLQWWGMTNVVYLHIPLALLGRWRSDNEDGRSEYRISVDGGALKVTARDFVDGEAYEVSGIIYDRTMIAFDTLMPSTGRRGHLVLKAGSVPGRGEQTFTFTDTLEIVRQDGDE